MRNDRGAVWRFALPGLLLGGAWLLGIYFGEQAEKISSASAGVMIPSSHHSKTCETSKGACAKSSAGDVGALSWAGVAEAVIKVNVKKRSNFFNRSLHYIYTHERRY